MTNNERKRIQKKKNIDITLGTTQHNKYYNCQKNKRFRNISLLYVLPSVRSLSVPCDGSARHIATPTHQYKLHTNT